MKTCKSGLHQYPDNKRSCPECARVAEKHRRQPGQTKTCQKGLHQYPSECRECPECRKIAKRAYRRKPEVKVKASAYKQKPEVKEREKQQQSKYRQNPEVKEREKQYNKEYQKRPEVKQRQKDKYQIDKEKHRARRQTPEYKATNKAWRQEYMKTPQFKKSNAIRKGKRTKIAAQGDLSNEQWDGRIIEFNGCCAYCHIQLLTMVDDIDFPHPQYLTMDHIVPLLPDGQPFGQNILANVVPACWKCNNSKDQTEVFEWMAMQGAAPSDQLLPILLKTTAIHYSPLYPKQDNIGTAATFSNRQHEQEHRPLGSCKRHPSFNS